MSPPTRYSFTRSSTNIGSILLRVIFAVSVVSLGMRFMWKHMVDEFVTPGLVPFWANRVDTKIAIDNGTWEPRPLQLDSSKVALEYTKTKKVFIAGVLRDNANALPMSLKLIDTIGQLFNESTVALYENDSTDATPQILADWARNHTNAANIHAISEKLDSPSAISYGAISKGRFAKLASFRNRYIDIFRKYASDYDYVAIIDVDLFDMSIDSFLSNFTPEALAHDWSIVGANGVCSRRRYYDTLALRTEKFTDTRIASQHDRVWRVYEPSEPWMPVTSVFGGMAIYKGACVGACRYEADGDCEHVSFNACVRSQPGCANAFMNPAFVFDYGFWRRIHVAHFFPEKVKAFSKLDVHPTNGVAVLDLP